MTSLIPTKRLVLLLALASSAYAYSNHLWHKDFDTFHKWSIIQEVDDCREAYATLNQKPRNSNSTALVDCILANTDEVTKAEFGVVAVMLGLLPGVLQLIGPKFSDLAVLATRRPFLSLFLTIASPCPAFDYETTGMEDYLVENSTPLWPSVLKSRRSWLEPLVSLLEYILAMAAAGNIVYQFYRLTFYAVVLISTQLGQYGGTIEAFAPLLWVFLGIPIHAVGTLQLYWCRAPPADAFASSMTPQSRTTIGSLLRNEVTPCAFATDIDPDSIRMQNGPIYQLLNWLIKLCIWTDVIYGIIVLSTILFVPMWSAIWMIGLIFTGTIACRLVLAFEMHGIREVPKTYVKDKISRVDNNLEMAQLIPEDGTALRT